jgi:prepilin-type N-terminal cleavage/methylation domain-containing protein
MKPNSTVSPIRAIANDAGFTLLEIIAVIVIMSILAIVAVPRYFDLQTQAKIRAFSTGKAEAIGRVNGYFAMQVLNGIAPGSINYSNATLDTNLGDFTINVTNGQAGGPNTFTITVTGNSNTPVAGMSSIVSIRRPGL